MTSYKHHIRLKCEDCVVDPTIPGSALEQITLCTVTLCPLWEVRPRIRYLTPEREKRLEARLFGSGVQDDVADQVLGDLTEKPRPDALENRT